MKFIIVQLSPKRFVVAEGSFSEYTVCTKKMTHNESIQVANELRELDTKDYSDLTKQVLLET